MKKFNLKNSLLNNIYSKTYTDRNQTLIVDNVKYQLANNKKTLIKIDNRNGIAKNGKQQVKLSNLQSTSKATKSSINKQRILKNDPFQLSKSFKSANRPVVAKQKAIRFNKLNNNIYKFQNKSTTVIFKSNLYKKIYNNAPRKDQTIKSQIVQQLSKKAVKSSINYLIKNKHKKNNRLKLSRNNTTYCMFFCRFGKCAKIATCKYKHDKDKVAVCKNFLKGKCEVNGCLLAHKIDPKKMPVCSYFLKGICNIDNCPYRHVNVNVNAKLCKDFLRGFCSEGDQCKLLHQYVQNKCKNNEVGKSKKASFKKKIADKESLVNNLDELLNNQETNQASDKSIELIELSSCESNSNMDISEDDTCCALDNNEKCLDFIPLIKDPDEVKEEQVVLDDNSNGRRSRLSEELNDHYDYESDDSWFEDEEKTMNEFIQYIPKFLLN